MRIMRLDEGVAVAGQPNEVEIGEIARQGFKMLVINRPDGEDFGQPGHERTTELARAAGLDVRFIPVTGPTLTAEKVQEFARALAEARGPVLAHCRSGTRSAVLWAAAVGDGDAAKTQQAIAKAAAQGVDASAALRFVRG
ncbi:MAG: TIGR01244 family phosphatase [Alphaproteobacteria bacterium]|nr:TIGR01244 family phosphatase [Alphaproteobacteria bacterium]